MPEFPEVETVRRGLAPVMEGAVVDRMEVRRPDLRFPFPEGFSDTLEGTRIVSLGRRAKYLLIDFAPANALTGNDVLIAHLGMSGSFRIEGDVQGNFHHARNRKTAHDHVVFHMRNGTTITYNDPRRFGFMLLAKRANLDQHPSFLGMGVEPVGNSLSGTVLALALAGKRTPLKAALLDQRIVAGLGNIYVCEALWRSGLSPRREARTLVRKNGAPTERVERLAGHIRAVIAEAIEAGGSSLRDHAQTDGELGYFQHRFAAYDREGHACTKPECDGTIARIVQSGRSTFYCATCQR